MKTRLQKVYSDKIVPELVKQFDYKNVMQIPALEKIVINMGVGENAQDSKKIQGKGTQYYLVSEDETNAGS